MRKTRIFTLCNVVFLLCLSLWARGQTTIDITGPSPVCKGSSQVYTVSVTPGITYQWTVSNNGNISSIIPNGSATVLWGLAGPGVLQVYGIDSLGDTTEYGIQLVVVKALPTPKITTDYRVACQSLIEPTETDPIPKFDDSGCIKVCAYSEVTYYATGTAGSNFDWVATGGNANPSSGPSTLVTWGGPGFGTLTVTETTQDGCVGTRTICIEIIESPLAHLVAMPDTTLRDVHVCDSTEVVFLDKSYSSPSSPIVSWSWDFGDGTYSNAQGSLSAPVTHTFTGPGTYKVTLTVTNSCGCQTSESINIVVEPFVGAHITCVGVMCEKGVYTYYTDQPCSSSSWSVLGGTILGASNNYVQVQWDKVGDDGFGYVFFDPAGCGYPCRNIAVARVPVILDNIPIQGETVLCPNTQYKFKLPQWPSTKFGWNISDPSLGTMYPSDQPNEIVFETGSTPGSLDITCDYLNTLLGCKGTGKLKVTILEPEEIIGDKRACFNSHGDFYFLANGNLGDWVLTYPDGTTRVAMNGSNSFINSLPYVEVGMYTLTVTGTTFCAPDPMIIRVDPLPPPPDNISGPDVICKGVPVEYIGENPVNGTTFNWKIANGSLNAAAGPSTYVTLNPASGGPFELKLWRQEKLYPYCASDTIIKIIDTPVVDPVISGDATPCKNSDEPYETSYTEGEGYEWTVAPDVLGSVRFGQNTPNVTVLWNDNGGQGWLICKMKKCFKEYIDSFAVHVSPPFPGGTPPDFTISTGSVCMNQTFTVNAVANSWTGSSIVWTFGDGKEHNGHTFTEQYKYTDHKTATTVYDINAYFYNPSGCPDGLDVTHQISVEPAPNPYVSPGLQGVCGTPWSVTLTAATIPGYSTPAIAFYQWVYNGSNIPGATAATYNATDPNTGYYQVIATSALGCSQISDSALIYDNCGGGGTYSWPSFTCDPGFRVTYGCSVVAGTRPVTVKWVGDISGGPIAIGYYNQSSGTWVNGSINGSTFNGTIGSTYVVGVKLYGHFDTCSVLDTITVPAMPVADFTFTRPTTCVVEADVKFTNTSLHGNTAYWYFGDLSTSNLYSPIRTYGHMPNLGNQYAVKMVVRDGFGCPDSITKNVAVIEDQLEGATGSNPKNPCEGTPVTLNYNPGNGFHQGTNYHWKKDLDVFAVTNSPVITTTVFESGYYTVNVTDQYGCYDNAIYDTVNIVQVPPAEIWADADQCVDVEYTLSGFAGNVGSLTYQWFDGSMTPIPGATWPELTDKQSAPGIYDYYLQVSIAKPGGGTCSKMSNVFHVNVHAAPVPPVISFNVSNCAPYQVDLDASPALPGTYNWSNGASGNPVTVPQGGAYQVTYTDQYGCQSKAAIMAPRHPQEYLWIFPSGCYTMCSTSSYTVLGPIIPFANWEYQQGHTPWLSGSGPVPSVTITSTGVYNLMLDNGYCSATSADMDINLLNCTRRGSDVIGIDGSISDVEAQAAASLGIVPNPAADFADITYTLAAGGKPHTLEVFDVLGRRLSSIVPTAPSGTWHLPLRSYAPGVYQVVLRQGDRVLLQQRLSVVR